MTHLSLHSASELLLLVATLAVFLTVLRTWRMLRKKRQFSLAPSEQIVSSSAKKPTSGHILTIFANHWPTILVFASGAAFGASAWQIHVEHRAPTFEFHNVKLVKVASQYRWLLKKDDGQFVADFCDDYDVSGLNPTPGEVMDKFRYQDLGRCISIKRSDLGIWWKRDANGWTIKETSE